jgi:hypothetical protein
MQSTTYRNYRISYHFKSGKWSAHVYRPSSPIIMRNGIINATAEEGEALLLERVHAMIDKAEALLPPLPPPRPDH